MIDYHGGLRRGGGRPESHEIHRGMAMGNGGGEYRGIGGKMVNIGRDVPISSAAAYELCLAHVTMTLIDDKYSSSHV